MATQTVTIYGSGSACVDTLKPDTPNTKETIIDVKEYSASIGEGYKIGFEKFVPPASILGKKIVSAVLHIYGRYNKAGIWCEITPISEDWDPSKTTYINTPKIDKNAALNVGEEFPYDDDSYSWREIVLLDYAVSAAGNKYIIGRAEITSFGFCVSQAIQYYTSNSNYKPYIVVTVQDTEGGLVPTSVYPKDWIFQNNKNGVTVIWENTITEGTVLPATQTKAVVNWSYGSTTQSAIVTGAATNYTIPAAQLPEQGAVTWWVTITDNGGHEKTTAKNTFTTTDATCYAYPYSPVNEYIDGSKATTFTWTRSIDTGTPANGADFQISKNDGTNWTDLGHTTGYGDLTVAANTLPSGNVFWRVRGYNSDGVAGPWSNPAAIVVRAAPNPPKIASVTAVPRPTVSWQAEGQQAYQLQVGDWDSGTVYGTDKSAQVPYALPNGPTQVRLRIQNNFGLWSNWSTTSVTIANKAGKAITVTTRVVLGGVRLTWTTEGNYPTYTILRDGEEIATVTGKEYTDYTGIGKSVYIVRGVAADSSYTDSPRAIEILKLRSGLIAVAGVWDWLPLRCLRGRYPEVETSGEAEITYTRFSGRKLPVAEFSGHYSRQHKLAFTFRDRSERDALWQMLGKLVVYKDMWERRFIGILDSVETVSDWADDTVFTITEVDHGPVF